MTNYKWITRTAYYGHHQFSASNCHQNEDDEEKDDDEKDDNNEGLEMRLRLEPQVCFFFSSFLYVSQVIIYK